MVGHTVPTTTAHRRARARAGSVRVGVGLLALAALLGAGGGSTAIAEIPETVIASGPTRPSSTATSATFTFRSPTAWRFMCSYGTGPFIPCASPYELTGLSNRQHRLRVVARNSSGDDPTPAEWVWTVRAPDPTPPDTRITSGASQPSVTRVATFVFRSSSPDASFSCRLDGAAPTTCTSPLRLSGLADGSHTFTVRSNTANGIDPTPATYTWRVAGSAVPTPPRNVNVLVINTDDQRAADTMAALPKTRRWFSAGGTKFTNGYVTTPDCCPSRSTLFSGRYAHNHGNVNNVSTKSLDHASTAAAYLEGKGYQTGMAGRFLLQWPLTVPPPFYRRYALITRNGYDNASFATDRGPVSGVYGTTEIGRQAVRMLNTFEARDTRPFYLYLAPFAPHAPFTPEPRYAAHDVGACSPSPAMLETDRTDKPAWVRDGTTTAATGCARREEQLRTLLSVDDMVDVVMTRLTALGEDRNTVALLMSDNGYQWGDHGLGEKWTPYTAAVEVPFFVRWPGKVAAGVRDARLVANIDVLPSVLAATAVAPALRHPLDGRPFLTATGLAPSGRPEALLEQAREPHTHLPAWRSIRSTRRQYVEWLSASGAVIAREYYDLRADPYQLTNLLGDASRTNDPDVSALRARLARYVTCRGTASAANPCP